MDNCHLKTAAVISEVQRSSPVVWSLFFHHCCFIKYICFSFCVGSLFRYLCWCFRPCQNHGLSLECVKQLQHMRIALAEFSLAMLGEHCTEKTRQVLARERMTSAEIALEEFLRSTPEPDSAEEVRRCTPRSLSVRQTQSYEDVFS